MEYFSSQPHAPWATNMRSIRRRLERTLQCHHDAIGVDLPVAQVTDHDHEQVGHEQHGERAGKLPPRSMNTNPFTSSAERKSTAEEPAMGFLSLTPKSNPSKRRLFALFSERPHYPNPFSRKRSGVFLQPRLPKRLLPHLIKSPPALPGSTNCWAAACRRTNFTSSRATPARQTTVALQFLLAGVKAGEHCLYLTFSQTAEALHKVARSHGGSLDGIELYEMDSLHPAELATNEQTIFSSAGVELNETVTKISEAIEKAKPARLVFDAMAQLRALANDTLRFNRQLFALRHQLSKMACTVLLLSRSEDASNMDDLCHGTIRLERQAPEYGNVRRRLLGREDTRPERARRLPQLQDPHGRLAGVPPAGRRPRLRLRCARTFGGYELVLRRRRRTGLQLPCRKMNLPPL